MIEYRVKPITRYVVTRYECKRSEIADTAPAVTERGTFDNYDTAYAVAYSLCSHEHSESGEDIDTMEFIYPQSPGSVGATPARGTLS